jgi:NTP pyrophosphatase (non-canonical NTP hydrolase)
MLGSIFHIIVDNESNLQAIYDFNTSRTQNLKTIEELIELIKELFDKRNGTNTNNIESEVADVLIMLSQLMMNELDQQKIKEQIKFKIDRQLTRSNLCS